MDEWSEWQFCKGIILTSLDPPYPGLLGGNICPGNVNIWEWEIFSVRESLPFLDFCHNKSAIQTPTPEPYLSMTAIRSKRNLI